ncbi:MAG: hypothetical protein U0610_04360 [bacterium]
MPFQASATSARTSSISTKGQGETSFSGWTLYTPAGSYDSWSRRRWAQFFHHHPEQIDVAYWADSYPNVTHVGVNEARLDALLA